MNTETYKPPSAQEQLSDLNQTLEKDKVELTQEVEKYTRDHVRIVHNKLQAGEPVYESDLAFIPKVKMWVLMPKEWREKYPSVEDMEKSEEVADAQLEANKRHISLKQWLDLLHVADAAKENKEWIDETFEFPGEGKIKVNEDLDLTDCTGLTKLPEGLSVGWCLWLKNCTGLTELPDGLTVGEGLYLRNCTGLTKLPDGLRVGWGLYLKNCTGLTKLPEELKVGGDLNINGCTGLTKLPKELKVGRYLILSSNLNEQVKKDAKRLKKERKIKRKIKYR